MFYFKTAYASTVPMLNVHHGEYQLISAIREEALEYSSARGFLRQLVYLSVFMCMCVFLLERK